MIFEKNLEKGVKIDDFLHKIRKLQDSTMIFEKILKKG